MDHVTLERAWFALRDFLIDFPTQARPISILRVNLFIFGDKLNVLLFLIL